MEWYTTENKPEDNKHLYIAITKNMFWGEVKGIDEAYFKNGEYYNNPRGIGSSKIDPEVIDYWAYKQIPKHPDAD